MGHITFSFTDYFQYLIIIINLAEDKDHCVIREMARMRCLLCKLLIVFMAFNEIFRVMCLSRYILALNVSVFKVFKIRNEIRHLKFTKYLESICCSLSRI